ncbi:TetR/AcrR family transcriptional regulator [Rothia nasisuis]|uniref:TetR/AcrR family transcriptional regulator n=1 Tax=Rothia nasisuis TaxID=2109647 RepID=UPI001F27711E|nr:TetR/AcrR family transcriptional regulator [Rothia nasisuis]
MSPTPAPTPQNFVAQRITEALVDLLRAQPLEAITISALCAHAQVGRASFYRHFDSKEQVLTQAAARLIQQWAHQLENDPSAHPAMVFESLFQHFDDYQPFYSVLYRQGMAHTVLDTIKQKLGLSDALPSKDAYPKAFLAYGIFGFIDEWFRRGAKESPRALNRLFATSVQINLAGLVALYQDPA